MADEDERNDLLGAAAGEFNREIEDDDFDGEEESSKGGGKKKLMLLLLVLLLLGGAGAGVYFSGILDGDEEKVAEEKDLPPPPPDKSIFVDLPDMLVNLNQVGGKPNFLKIRVSLEVAQNADTTALMHFMPRVMDIVQVYVRELRLTDLRTGKGLSALRRVLLTRINKAVDPVEIKTVLFRDMLVQ